MTRFRDEFLSKVGVLLVVVGLSFLLGWHFSGYYNTTSEDPVREALDSGSSVEMTVGDGQLSTEEVGKFIARDIYSKVSARVPFTEKNQSEELSQKISDLVYTKILGGSGSQDDQLASLVSNLDYKYSKDTTIKDVSQISSDIVINTSPTGKLVFKLSDLVNVPENSKEDSLYVHVNLKTVKFQDSDFFVY